MPKRVLTDVQTAAILQRRRRGEGMLLIATDLGVPYKRVTAICQDAGLSYVGVDTGGRRHQDWTPEEDETLSGLVGAGMPVEDIADAMSRSTQGIQRRMGVLGLVAAPSPTKAVWSAENVAVLRTMVRDGAQVSDIARQFQTTPRAIVTKLSKLGLRHTKRLTENERWGLETCLRDGMSSPARIARQIGVPVDVVEHHLRLRETVAA